MAHQNNQSSGTDRSVSKSITLYCNPEIRGGRPCVEGSTLWLGLIIDYFRLGWSAEEMMNSIWPDSGLTLDKLYVIQQLMQPDSLTDQPNDPVSNLEGG